MDRYEGVGRRMSQALWFKKHASRSRKIPRRFERRIQRNLSRIKTLSPEEKEQYVEGYQNWIQTHRERVFRIYYRNHRSLMDGLQIARGSNQHANIRNHFSELLHNLDVEKAVFENCVQEHLRELKTHTKQ